MKQRIYLNNDWTFWHEDNPDVKETVRLPHANVETPFNYFDEHIYQFVSVYEKTVTIPKELKGKLLFLTFEGAAHKADVFVNGEPVMSHQNGYTAFKADISSFVKWGKENTIKVVLDSRETLNVPPFGHVIDYLTYGGIYREVYLDVMEPTHIEDIFVYTTDITPQIVFRADTTLALSEVPGSNLFLQHTILRDGDVVFEAAPEPVTSGGNRKIFSGLKLDLWSPDHPAVYTLRSTLLHGDSALDVTETDFGIRTARFEKDGFYLNGQLLKIRGLNRHQCWPYVGYAMPQAAQEYDVNVLKDRLGVNAVRTSHYPMSKYFLNACNRRGLLVFTESPGWQNIGDAAWKEQHIANVREMVLQYRNHPSIVLWGVRINESMDDNELYTRANEVARELDPTRQTSGVRYIPFSNLLEDVYAYNDFSHTGNNPGIQKKYMVTPKAWKPYLVSEHNGHMFPTKSFDCEDHRLSQSLRHARVLDDMYDPKNGVSGAFGWCMFDYNTHKDFGSGDRICYHGVLDMFRNPKMAAYVYASQGDQDDVCFVSSSMDIGEHPGGSLGDVYVFTNADYINLYKNGEFVRRFDPDRETWPNLPHPPMKIDDLIGELLEKNYGMTHKSSESIKSAVKKFNHDGIGGVVNPVTIGSLGASMVRDKINFEKAYDIFGNYVGNWGTDVTTYRIDAVKGDRVVKSITKCPMSEFALDVTVDHTALTEDTTYDVATVNITAVSGEGNPLVFASDVVSFSTRGPVQLIGPKAVPLRGGMTGTYVKTTGRNGKASLTIKCDRCPDIVLDFTVKVNKDNK